MMLEPSELQRLSKLLGLTGLAHDGEALAAARKAHDLIKAKNMTWPAVLGFYDNHELEPVQTTEKPAHHADLMDLLRAGKGVLTNFERNFLLGILGHIELSSKQARIFEGIRCKIEAATVAG